MNKIELKRRTKRFAIDVIKFIEKLPNSRSLNVLSNQLLRSSSSVGANYRSACRGKSTADFINKIIIVEEEADESVYFLELLKEFNPSFQERIIELIAEGIEILKLLLHQ